MRKSKRAGLSDPNMRGSIARTIRFGGSLGKRAKKSNTRSSNMQSFSRRALANAAGTNTFPMMDLIRPGPNAGEGCFIFLPVHVQ